MKKMFLILLFVLSFSPALLSRQDGGAPVFRYRSGVFVREWLVCGPFKAHGNASIYQDYLGGEEEVVPVAGDKVISEDTEKGYVFWRTAHGNDDGRLDFTQWMHPNQHHVAYAAVTIHCAEKTPAFLLTGSNDMEALWLNGRRVFVYSSPRASGPDADRVAVTFKKGDNLLLAKVQNVGGGWWLYMRFAGLYPLDSAVFTTAPLLGPVTARHHDTLQNIYSVTLYNISSRPAGPVTMTLGEGRPVARRDRLAPKSLCPLYAFVPYDSTAGSTVHTTVTLASPQGHRSFPLTANITTPADGTTYFVQGFHVDPVWRDSQAGYQALSFSNLSQYLRAACGDSGYDFVMSEIPYLKPYYDLFPADRPLIRRLVQEGRTETCGSYNQPNETTIAGEALIRNILYGRLFHENVLGDHPRVYQPWDVFGHILQLPQILHKSGFIGTVWTRSNYRSPTVRVPDIPDLYFARSPDGTLLPTRKVNYGFPDTRGDAGEREMQTRRILAEDMKEQQQQIAGIRSDLRLNAVDEKAPTAWMVGRSPLFNTFVPRVKLDAGGAEQYFRDVQRYLREGLDIPVMTRDVSQYNEGCGLSRLDLKMGNRMGENALFSAEKFSVFASVLGMPYPATALDEAWRLLLFGQHHDGITGCGADVPYLDLVLGYHKALSLADSSLYAGLHFIEQKINTRHHDPHAIPVTVFNPLNWQRSDVVTVTVHFGKPVKGFRLTGTHGRTVATRLDSIQRQRHLITAATFTFIADSVPSMGYRTWWVVPGRSTPPTEQKTEREKQQIENGYYRITADARTGGGITSLWDKRYLKEFLSTKKGLLGNEIILLKEGDGFEPAWRYLTTGKKIFSADHPATIEIYRSPVSERMVVTGDMPRMKKLVQEIILWKDIDRIDFRTRLVDYRGLEGRTVVEGDTTALRNERDLFVVVFPPSITGGVPVLEDRFATKVYFRGKEAFSYTSTSTEWTSHHSMNSCYQWFDRSWSVKINFGGRYNVTPGPAEIVTPRDTLLQHAGFRLQRALARRGVTATPAHPDVQRSYDIQYRRFCFSAGPLGGNRYNDTLMRRMNAAGRDVIRRQLQKKGYAYAFVYDKHLAGAWFPYPVLMIVGRDKRTTRLALDNLTRQLTKSRELRLPVEAYLAGGHPWTEDYGLALLNRGTISVGTEPDGTMTMALMHTIPWQSPLLNWTHDFPERKTHLFEYALKPHKGNWQDGGIVYSGYEYNNPLVALQGTQHEGLLPPARSFLRTGGGRAVVSSVKAAATGREAFSGKKKTSPAGGIIVRLYEPEGRRQQVRVTSAFPIISLHQTDLMERETAPVPHDSNTFSCVLTPYDLETFRFTTDVALPQEGGYEPAGGEAVYCRYWEHNDGAAPAGYLPVNVRLAASPGYDSGESRKDIRQVTVWVSNDLTDTPVQGTVTLTTPPGVRAVPDTFNYHVGANGEQSYPVTLVVEGTAASGFIRADITWQGNTFFDVLPFRLPEKKFGHADNIHVEKYRLRWNVVNDSNSVTVTLTNPFAQAVDGEVSLAGPVETWGDCPTNSIARMTVTPWHRSFHLPAGGTATLHFSLSHTPGEKYRHYWLAARLSWYGYVDYKPAVGHLETVKR